MGSFLSFLSFFKIFQILEILVNFEKINVKFGIDINLVYSFMSALKIPEIESLSSMSPIAVDGIEYLEFTSGQKGKITKNNSEIFLLTGQNMIFSLIFIGSWLILQIMTCFNLQKNFLAKMLICLFRLIFSIFYFDFQMICAAEIGGHDIKKDQPKHLYMSYFVSSCVLFIIVHDLMDAFIILKRRTLKSNRVRIDAKKDFSTSLTLELYNEGMSTTAKEKMPYWILIEKIRFLSLQIVIAGLQMLNRFQATIIFAINLVYFTFFLKSLKKHKLYSLRIVKYKMIVQEVCIMFVLLVIWIFSFTYDKGFSDSYVYKALEIFIILCMFLAAITEFLNLMSSIISDIFLGNKKKQQKIRLRDQAKLENFDNDILNYLKLNEIELKDLKKITKKSKKKVGISIYSGVNKEVNMHKMKLGKSKRAKKKFQAVSAQRKKNLKLNKITSKKNKGKNEDELQKSKKNF